MFPNVYTFELGLVVAHTLSQQAGDGGRQALWSM